MQSKNFRKPSLKRIWLFLLFFVNICPAIYASTDFVEDPYGIYDKTTEIVTKNFYDRTFRGLPWTSLIQQYRNRFSSQVRESHFKNIINGLLSELKTSHTIFLTDSDQEYWAIKSIFSRKINGVPLWQIGAWFQKKEDGQWYVKSVFLGSPAEKAGILPGDQLLKINGKSVNPVKSFWKKQQPISVEIKRNKSNEPRIIKVKPEFKSFQEVMFRDSQLSTKIFVRKQKRIGYFHLWMGTHSKFEELLKKIVVQMAKETDAFVLDLRDGFGGAHPGYLNPFFDKDEEGKPLKQIYSKPMIALINEGTRSGKEWLAYILKEKNRARLIGSKTAGAFIGAKPFEIKPKKYLLYLAIDGNGPDGVDIEGKGISPHIEVPYPLPFSEGHDPQLEKALEVAKGSLTDMYTAPE